jgi:hypothetical protein
MKSISPVFTRAQVHLQEIVDQNKDGRPNIFALILDFVIKGKRVPNSGMAFRLRLDDEERALIAAGGDLIVTEMTFGKPFVAVNIQICKEGEIPTYNS